MAKNIFEVAEQYKSHKIGKDSADYMEVSEALKDLWKTEDGKMELATKVYEKIQNDMIRTDISQYIFSYKIYDITDVPVYREKKKGIRAYWIAPNSATPRSQNYDTEFTMDFDYISVSPTCQQDDLVYGKVDSFAEMIADAAEAVQDAIDIRTYAIIQQSYSASANSDQFFPVSTALSEEALQNAIKKVKTTGKGNISIICRYEQALKITTFTGFQTVQLSDSAKDEIRSRGYIGNYLGCKLVVLEADSRDQIPTNLVFVVCDKIGYAATKITNKVGQETDMDDWSWVMKADFMKGWVILHPEYMALIKIT